MNVATYSLICYGLTALISFALIGVVLLINKAMSRSDRRDGAQGQG